MLGFDEYNNLLKLYLKRYREVAKNERVDDKDKEEGEGDDDEDDDHM